MELLPLFANVIVFSPAFRPETSNLYSDGSMLASVSGSGACRADVLHGELAEHAVLEVRTASSPNVQKYTYVPLSRLIVDDARRTGRGAAAAAGRPEHESGIGAPSSANSGLSTNCSAVVPSATCTMRELVGLRARRS